MTSRKCDVCKGGISLGPEGFEESLGGKKGRIVWTHPLCQSCIIEAIGKMYVERIAETIDEEIEENIRRLGKKEQCIHGTTLGNECRECMKDEKDQFSNKHISERVRQDSKPSSSDNSYPVDKRETYIREVDANGRLRRIDVKG